MSMISEFVKKIRIYEREYRSGDNLGRAIVETEEILKEAADIIEELSAKLAGANMERSEQYYNDVPDINVGSWIPVSEKLPDEEGSYLVTFDDGYVSSAPFYDEDWELWCDSGEPVAWMPLPQPYKEE